MVLWHPRVRETGRPNFCDGPVVVAWNVGTTPLIAGVIPPFLIGRDNLYFRWFLHEAVKSGKRLVVDVSHVAIALKISSTQRIADKFTSSGRGYDFNRHVDVNRYLAFRYGSLTTDALSFRDVPLILTECQKAGTGGLCFRRNRRHRNDMFSSVDRCDCKRQVAESTSLSRNISNSARHGLTSGVDQVPFGALIPRNSCNCSHSTTSNNCPEDSQVPSSSHIGSNLTMEELLRIVASPEKLVIVATAGRNYFEMLMSWVCRLRALKLANFVVAALDEETLTFATLHGLPVFAFRFTDQIPRDDCWFGTQCFQKVTKQKSRLVLEILKLGYSVLFSDVDVYWFRNPLPELTSFHPATLVVQSDQFNDTGPDNAHNRINSGFYFAASHPSIIAAFELIVEHASKSNQSEQPSFYQVLCGDDGRFREGSNRCTNTNISVSVHFLSRQRYPNGLSNRLWQNDIKEICIRTGCVVVHNNWVSGRKNKLARQVEKGLMEWNANARICNNGWENNNSKRIF